MSLSFSVHPLVQAHRLVVAKMAPLLSLFVGSLFVAQGFAGVFEKLPGVPEGKSFRM